MMQPRRNRTDAIHLYLCHRRDIRSSASTLLLRMEQRIGIVAMLLSRLLSWFCGLYLLGNGGFGGSHVRDDMATSSLWVPPALSLSWPTATTLSHSAGLYPPESPFGLRSLRWTTLSSSASFVDSSSLPPDQHHLSSSSAPLYSSSPTLRTNQDIVKQQSAVAQAKKRARQLAVQEVRQRNRHYQQLLSPPAGDAYLERNATHAWFSSSSSTTTAMAHPVCYAMKIHVGAALRDEMKLSGRERRGRMFLEAASDATVSFRAFQQELHAFFRALRRDSYLLQASIPLDSSMDSYSSTSSSIKSNNSSAELPRWPIQNDHDVVETFRKANEWFLQQQQRSPSADEDSAPVRPSIVIHVEKNPHGPATMAPPAYLLNLPPPDASPTMTMLSFYSFPPGGIPDPDSLALELRRLWKPFHALGRVYVATEGINAQMSVPTTALSAFRQCCHTIPSLGPYMENGINIDPVPLTRAEFAVAGVPIRGAAAPPFRNLHVRVRAQIVADGLDRSLDWQQAGYDMPPIEWHVKLKNAREKASGDDPNRQGTAPVILDCRNTYETAIGIFDGATPLNTDNFRDTWDVLHDRLRDTPKDAPIMTYCTGGIRCVKVGAYLTQTMGFTNVSRLAGGIIAYDRDLRAHASGEEPMFKGTNFVFDGRLGREITKDALGECCTCGIKTSFVSNCQNENCHKRMVQCDTCENSFLGTCSEVCRTRVVNHAMWPRRVGGATTPLPLVLDNSDTMGINPHKIRNDAPMDVLGDDQSLWTLDRYTRDHSSSPPSVYEEIDQNTQTFMPSGSHMVSGQLQGRLLTQLASMTREGRILELGTFTGYATTCFLEGAANVASLLATSPHQIPMVGSRTGGPYVLSMERDARAYDVAVAHLRIVADHQALNGGDQASQAMKSLRVSGATVPTVPEGSVPITYRVSDKVTVDCEVMRVTDALAMVEAMSHVGGDPSRDAPDITMSSRLLREVAPFDLVFLDADKTRMLDYVEALLTNDRVLKKGGIIVVDNVLWKGLVLDAASSSRRFNSMTNDSENHDDENGVATRTAQKKNRRARKLANHMHQFNHAMVHDPRVEVVLVPLRDGLSVIRKKVLP